MNKSKKRSLKRTQLSSSSDEDKEDHDAIVDKPCDPELKNILKDTVFSLTQKKVIRPSSEAPLRNWISEVIKETAKKRPELKSFDHVETASKTKLYKGIYNALIKLESTKTESSPKKGKSEKSPKKRNGSETSSEEEGDEVPHEKKDTKRRKMDDDSLGLGDPKRPPTVGAISDLSGFALEPSQLAVASKDLTDEVLGAAPSADLTSTDKKVLEEIFGLAGTTMKKFLQMRATWVEKTATLEVAKYEHKNIESLFNEQLKKVTDQFKRYTTTEIESKEKVLRNMGI